LDRTEGRQAKHLSRRIATGYVRMGENFLEEVFGVQGVQGGRPIVSGGCF